MRHTRDRLFHVNPIFSLWRGTWYVLPLSHWNISPPGGRHAPLLPHLCCESCSGKYWQSTPHTSPAIYLSMWVTNISTYLSRTSLICQQVRQLIINPRQNKLSQQRANNYWKTVFTFHSSSIKHQCERFFAVLSVEQLQQRQIGEARTKIKLNLKDFPFNSPEPASISDKIFSTWQ